MHTALLLYHNLEWWQGCGLLLQKHSGMLALWFLSCVGSYGGIGVPLEGLLF